MGEARKAMFAQNNQMEWGTPILYLRASEERVFDIQTGAADANHDEASAIEQKAWDTIKMKLFIEQQRAELQAAKAEEIHRQQQWAALYKQGREHFDTGNWPEALDALLQLRDVTGDYRELAVLIAKVERRTGKQKAISVRYPARTTPTSSTKATRRWVPISTLVGLFLAALIGFAMASFQTDAKPESSQHVSSTNVVIEPTLTANVVNIGQKEEHKEEFPAALPAPKIIARPSATTRKQIQVSAPKVATAPVVQTQAPSVTTPSLDVQASDSSSFTIVAPTEIAVWPTEVLPTATTLSPTATEAPIEPTSQPPTATEAPIEPTSQQPTATQAPTEPTSQQPTATQAPIEPAPTEPASLPPTATEAPIEPAPTEPASLPTAVLAENTTP